jgi:hypothetical protein
MAAFEFRARESNMRATVAMHAEQQLHVSRADAIG